MIDQHVIDFVVNSSLADLADTFRQLRKDDLKAFNLLVEVLTSIRHEDSPYDAAVDVVLYPCRDVAEKVRAIKEVRDVFGVTLHIAKRIVEMAPVRLAGALYNEYAHVDSALLRKLAAALTVAGCTVQVVE